MIAPTLSLKWSFVGGPPVGTVLAVAMTGGGIPPAFAAASTGLYIPTAKPGQPWLPLPGVSGTTTAIAVSPDFARDRTLIMGTPLGLYASFDRGVSWTEARLPRTTAHIQTLVLSPNFVEDGMAFAGTLEDGVFCSTDRGLNWFAWNFRLLDPSVLCLAVSPDFANDQTVYAGTATALYRSTNGGRAWRELSLPCGEAAILCLALSPSFAQDGTLLAGTESEGLFRSRDRGQSWQAVRVAEEADCIDALAYAGDVPLVALADGIYASLDGGETWQRVMEQTDILCLAVGGGLAVAGLADIEAQ